jgi:hypothetical protein
MTFNRVSAFHLLGFVAVPNVFSRSTTKQDQAASTWTFLSSSTNKTLNIKLTLVFGVKLTFLPLFSDFLKGPLQNTLWFDILNRGCANFFGNENFHEPFDGLFAADSGFLMMMDVHPIFN